MISFIEIRDGIGLAMDAIKSNKFRAGMTILGVLIAVATVLGLASIIAGLDKKIVSEIEGLGSNVIFVTRFEPDVDRGELSEEDRNRKWIDFEAAQAIRENCPSVTAVAPENYYTARGGNVIKYKNNQANYPSMFGTLPDYIKVTNRVVSRGRFFNDFEEQRRAMVCVLGDDVATALFPNDDPINKNIRINTREFLVVGVLEKLDNSFVNAGGVNNFVAIPYGTFEKLIPWEKALFLRVSADGPDKIDQAMEEIITTMRGVRGVPYNKDNDFAVWTQDKLKDMAGDIANVIYIAMIVISSVGLMVGGVGVMNIMLVSVTERTREIGVRKAIGAKRMNIIIQFLTEAMTLSATGGVLGIIAGILLALLAKLLFSLPFTVSMLWMFIGFTVSIMVGLVAGIYPAFKAARTDPIISLRYE